MFQMMMANIKLIMNNTIALATIIKSIHLRLMKAQESLIFNTDLESVYDTVDYTTSESTRNTYTYLYLPLYAGVKLYEFRRLSLNLQAGIIYSVMIGQHEPEASYTNDQCNPDNNYK